MISRECGDHFPGPEVWVRLACGRQEEFQGGPVQTGLQGSKRERRPIFWLSGPSSLWWALHSQLTRLLPGSGWALSKEGWWGSGRDPELEKSAVSY